MLLESVSRMAALGQEVKICAIDGMAGVGKSAFAIHAAHKLTPRYPDGQLFSTFTPIRPGQEPVTAGEALGALLLTTGVAAQMIPPDADSRAAMWRDHITNKRILLVLDDAAGHEQVLPLLPGTQDCLVLITSRRRLAALHDAEPLTLDTLPDAQAARLFDRLVGRRARETDPAYMSKIVDLCGTYLWPLSWWPGDCAPIPRGAFLTWWISFNTPRTGWLRCKPRTSPSQPHSRCLTEICPRASSACSVA